MRNMSSGSLNTVSPGSLNTVSPGSLNVSSGSLTITPAGL